MKYGLIGEKLGHSFSKNIHEQLASYTYTPTPLTKEEFPVFMEKKEFAAINVTIPYKESVLPYLDFIEENAKKIGAVNTIVNRDGKLFGYNTDYSGFRYMLEKNNIEIKGKKVLILGKGGAAKAVYAVVSDLQARECLTVYYKSNPETITYEQCYALHNDAEVIINTTPVGMHPNVDASPISLDSFHNLEAVVDVIYNPLSTRFVLDGKQKNVKSIGGLEMLVAQAKYAVEIFQNVTIDDAKIESLVQELKGSLSNIVFIGISGCGKTTIGKMLAERLHKAFVDVDDIIVERIKMPIPSFFSVFGEDAFRKIESEVIRELATKNGLVISTGGGAVLRAENMDYLKMNGRILWLKREPELLQTGHGRPLAPNMEAVKALYDARLPLYETYGEEICENNGDLMETVETLENLFSSKI